MPMTARIAPPNVLFHDGADNASLSDVSRKALSRFVRSSPIGREVTMSTRPDFTFARAKFTPGSNASFRSTSAARSGSRYRPGTSTRVRWPSSFAFSKCHENFQDPCRAAPCTSCDARYGDRIWKLLVYALKIIFEAGIVFTNKDPPPHNNPYQTKYLSTG